MQVVFNAWRNEIN
jgi:hypothetical protein